MEPIVRQPVRRNRLLAGLAALAAAGAFAAVPSSAATADPLTVYPGTAPTTCHTALPDGTPITVSTQDGVETARPTDPAAVAGGLISVTSAGHQLLLPATALPGLATGAVDPAAYDTAALAQHQCGLTAPTPAYAPRPHGPYTLGRLTIHTLDETGAAADAFVLLTNVDNENLGRVYVDTDTGLAQLNVPVGHYAAMMMTFDSLTQYRFTVAADVTVTPSGGSLTLDARTSTISPAIPSTPRPATLESTSIGFSRGDGTAVPDWLDYFNLSPAPTTLLINPIAPVQHGLLVVNPDFELTSPPDAATPYQYHLSEPADQVTPTTFATSVSAAQLATVTRNYVADTPGTALASNTAEPLAEARSGTEGLLDLRGLSLTSTGQTVTEYFTAYPGTVWKSIVDGDAAGDDEEISSPFVLHPGQSSTQSFHAGASHPGVPLDTVGNDVVCGACAARGTLEFDLYPFNDNNPGDVAIADPAVPAGSTESIGFQLSRNGSLVTSAAQGAQGVGVTVPTGRADFQLTETTQRQLTTMPLSTSATTTWSFTADPGAGPAIPAGWTCPDGGAACTALPLLYAYYGTDGSLTNTLTPGQHTLTLQVAHQQRSVAPPITGASVAVSYDDGANWLPAGTVGGNGHYRATFTVPTPPTGGGFVSVRVSAWDAAGDRIDQTVLRAYRVG